MKTFRIVPQIYEFSTFQEFAQAFSLGEKDLIVTQRFTYDPFIRNLHLPCPVIFQEDYGKEEPTDLMVNRIVQALRDVDYRRVVAVGGGTVIDICKLLAQQRFDDVEEIFAAPEKSRRDKPLLAVPTTCGTGSEVTRSAIIHSTARQTKVRMAYDQFFATAAVLIPQLLTTLPYAPFAFSAIDALVHGVESYLSPNATTFSQIFSLQAVELLVRSFRHVADHGPDSRQEVLADVQKASNYAGIAFGNAGCGAVHALSFPLSGRYHVSHGESNYQFFTSVLEMYVRKDPSGRMGTLCHRLGELLDCPPQNAIEQLAALLEKIWHKKTLREFGMKEEEIAEFAQEVYRDLQPVLATSYLPLSEEELMEINQTLY